MIGQYCTGKAVRGDDQSEVYIKLELPNIQGLIIALETCKDFKVI